MRIGGLGAVQFHRVRAARFVGRVHVVDVVSDLVAFEMKIHVNVSELLRLPLIVDFATLIFQRPSSGRSARSAGSSNFGICT